jgi:hypothetical protein
MSTPSTSYLTDGAPQGNSTGGVAVTPNGAYPPASFIATPNVTLPASLSDFTSSNQTSNLSWIRQAFMLNTLPQSNGALTDISTQDMARRIWSDAAFNWADTTLGGDWPVNVPPQFTEFSDITMGGDQQYQNAPNRTTMTTSGSYGMGRAYYEIIRRNSQLVTMSFGVQAFNSLSSFFGNFYDPQASSLVREGRAKSIFFSIGKAAGYLLSVPFKPIVFGSQLIKSALNIPSTRFSYFKPTMPLYWNAVATILNGITANLGIHPRQLSAEQQANYLDPNSPSSGTGGSSDITQEIALMQQFLPSIFVPNSTDSNGNPAGGGYIDPYAVSIRAQMLHNAFIKKFQNALDNAASTSGLQQSMLNVLSGNLTASPLTDTSGQSVASYLSQALMSYLATAAGSFLSDAAAAVESMAADDTPSASNASSSNNGGTSGNTGTATNNSSNNATATPSSNANSTGTAVSNGSTSGTTSSPSPPGSTSGSSSTLSGMISNWWEEFWNAIKPNIQDGANYVTFRTDYGGTIGESFSNTMKNSDLQDKINSQSSDARMTSFDLAGGNIVGGAVGAVVGTIASKVSDVVSGIAAGLQISGVAALAGAAYVDIPKIYDSSDVQMPSQSFTIELRSWSGHRLALLQNLYFPLACLLAGVLPRATGSASYNGPFCCQIWSKGRMQIRNGLITDMTITRGTGNLGWNAENQPLGIDITFTVRDYSSIMYMPIVAATGTMDKAILAAGDALGSLSGAVLSELGSNTTASQGGATGTNIASYLISGPYSDYSLFTDYLAILAALDWKDQVYPMRKWTIARDNAVLNYDTFKSPYRAAGWLSDTWAGQFMSMFVHGTDRP